MSLESHLDELTAKHRELQNRIDEAMTHPSVDSVEVTRLKRRKLQVKDEIARLQSSLAQH